MTTRKVWSCSHPAAPPSLLAGQPTLGLSTTATCWDPCEPPAASPPRQPSPRITSGRGVGPGHPGPLLLPPPLGPGSQGTSRMQPGAKTRSGGLGGHGPTPRPKQEDRRALLTAGTRSGGHQDWRNAPRPPSLPPPTTAAPNPWLSREPAPATNTGTRPQPCLQGSAQGQTSSRHDLGPRR